MSVYTSNKKKLIIIGPNIGMGGVERASSNLANSLSRENLEVHYLALIPKPQFFSLDAAVHYEEPSGFNKRHLNLINTVLFIRSYIRRQKPDFIIGFTKFYAAVANLALWLSPYGIIITERSSPLYKWPRHIELFCRLSFILKRPLGVVSQTSTAAEYHQKYYKGIPNTVIPNALRRIQSYPYLQKKKWILAVGRLNDDCKGFDRLVQAFRLLRNNEWRLVFAGGTREEGQYLLDLVESSSTKDRIDFLGQVKEIDRIYAQAGMFVIPSRSEGFPNALCEAMSAGLPCISFDFISGPKDIIKDGENGLIVEEGNIEKLAEKIDYLIDNEEFRREIGQEARKIAPQLDNERIARIFIDFINTITPVKSDKYS